MNKKDHIYARPMVRPEDFAFDEKVADVFEDMIKRSVPGYENVIIMSGLFAERFALADSNCYDLGCSLGATTLSMRHQITARGCKIIAVDKSEAMIACCRKIVENDWSPLPVEVLCEDIRKINYHNNSLTAINFTLQFIPPEERAPLLRKIYDSMLPGAVLILSEKITFAEPIANRLFNDIYHAWKAHNGYSEMEIRQKRSALEKVLIPDTIETHKQRLEQIGFQRCELWFQCFNFMSMVAFR